MVLNEKFPVSVEQPVANTNNIPEDFKEFVQELVDELERTKAQLVEKEQELDKVVREKTSETSKISQLKRDLVQVRQEKSAQQSELREERDRLSSENRLLRTKSLSNKNEKSSEAISPGKKQSNYASAAFVLSGAFAVGACLAIPNWKCIPLAVTAFTFFTIGCYCSYKANTILSDVKSTQLGNLERS